MRIFSRPRVDQPPGAAAVHLPKSFSSFVLLMAASKGGTGKSTLSINLAVRAARDGISTAVIDADIEDNQLSCFGWAEARQDASPKVVKSSLGKVPAIAAEARHRGYKLIIIDTPGRDLVTTMDILKVADFMLTPSRPSPLDMRATAPIRRLWGASTTPAAIVLNSVTHATASRTERYIERYADLGRVLPATVGQRVQYVDAIEAGQGVSEYQPGGAGDLEMGLLLGSIFTLAEARRSLE
jgi:chromosome partitioning protein